MGQRLNTSQASLHAVAKVPNALLRRTHWLAGLSTRLRRCDGHFELTQPCRNSRRRNSKEPVGRRRVLYACAPGPFVDLLCILVSLRAVSKFRELSHTRYSCLCAYLCSDSSDSGGRSADAVPDIKGLQAGHSEGFAPPHDRVRGSRQPQRTASALRPRRPWSGRLRKSRVRLCRCSSKPCSWTCHCFRLSRSKSCSPVQSGTRLHGSPHTPVLPVISTPAHGPRRCRSRRRFFDPKHWRIVLVDQRGCGASTPRGCLQDNTTQALVADFELLRRHLDIDTWVLFGGSWGTALSLAYAQAHTHRHGSQSLRL